MINTVYIGLGTNQGNRVQFLQDAIKMLANHPQISICEYSSIYETEPVGYTDQPKFLNMVVRLQTSLTAFDLLDFMQQIENELGRKREIRWGPRTIDLDILLYNNENINSERLLVPHPRMFERAFVVIPLLEINNEISNKYKIDNEVSQDSQGLSLFIQREDVLQW